MDEDIFPDMDYKPSPVGGSTAERLILLEYTVALMRNEQRATNRKLDELLLLKNRGVGAFWLASTLMGTGIIGAVMLAFNWLKGHI